MHRIVRLTLLMVTLCYPLGARSELKVAAIFGDNMVLQRDQKVPVWGWAEAGESVSVSAAGMTVSTTADAAGVWSLMIGPFAVGEPFDLTVAGRQTITFRQVVAGEVWICSGQSNMEWTMNRIRNAPEEMANANYPAIRQVKIDKATSLVPLDDCGNSGWQVCSPTTVGGFTAVGYCFARHLHEQLNVPIGLINTSWGGTIVETWTSAGALKSDPDFSETIDLIRMQSTNAAAAQVEYDTRLAVWQAAYDRAMNSDQEQWQVPAYDDQAWKSMRVPGNWEGQGLPGLDGLVWFRHSLSLPDGWAGHDLTLSMCAIDDIDTTWVNGARVGGMSDWQALRRYTVPASVVGTGRLSLAVRVLDTAGMGGFHGNPSEMKLECPGQAPISLAGEWRYAPSLAMADVPAKPEPPLSMGGPNHPTLLFNAMLNPIIPYGMRGAIWYQGESNAGRAYQYRRLFPLMIQDWRAQWKNEFPFYFVQLANFMQPAAEPEASAWAELREAQSMTLALPRTGQAVIIDVGEANDIHPRNKQDVGRRLALIALAKDYGRKDLVYSGPTYRSMTIQGAQVRLAFEHVGGGLKANDGHPLRHFSIAGADRKFVWADAAIDGADVVVSSPQVAEPAAVRYAWANNPEGCNLYNTEGLPASPFRTDDWPGTTINSR